MVQQVTFSAWKDAHYEHLLVSLLLKGDTLMRGTVLHDLLVDCYQPNYELLRPGFQANSSHCLLLDSATNDLAFLKLYGHRLLAARRCYQYCEDDDYWLNMLNQEDESESGGEAAHPAAVQQRSKQRFREIQRLVGTLLNELEPSAEQLLRRVTMANLVAFHSLAPTARVSELTLLRSSLSADEQRLPCSFYRTQVNPSRPTEYLLLFSALSGKQTLHRTGTAASADGDSGPSRVVMTSTHETLLRQQLDFVKILEQALWSCRSDGPIFSSDIFYAFPGTPLWNGSQLLRAMPLGEAQFRTSLNSDLTKYALTMGMPRLKPKDLRTFTRQKAAGTDPEYAGHRGLSGKRAEIAARLMATPVADRLEEDAGEPDPTAPDPMKPSEVADLVADMMKHTVITNASIARGLYEREWRARHCNSKGSDHLYQPDDQWAALDLIGETLSKFSTVA